MKIERKGNKLIIELSIKEAQKLDSDIFNSIYYLPNTPDREVGNTLDLFLDMMYETAQKN